MTELEINAFLSVVRLKSISAAAGSLYVTQPALSRRIQALENELGYTLFIRKKGQRIAELTEEGRDFVPIAGKYVSLWKEAKGITACKRNKILNIASVGSVSSYLLPGVFSAFMTAYPDYRLSFHNYHSSESYNYMAGGELDIALISDDRYEKNVETIPLFREKILLVTGKKSKYINTVYPSDLNPADELRLPWNPEYDIWHDFWFKNTIPPRFFLNQMSLLEYFITRENVWAMMPASVAFHLKKVSDAGIKEVPDGPPDRIIYYLKGNIKKEEIVDCFLNTLYEELENYTELELYAK